MGFIEKWIIKNILGFWEAIMDSMYGSIEAANEQTIQGFKNLFNTTDSSIYDSVLNITNKVVLPIAIIILLIFLILDLSTKMAEVNLKSDTAIANFTSFGLKLILGILLITSAPTVVSTTYDIANAMVKESNKAFEQEEIERLGFYDILEKNIKNSGGEINTDPTAWEWFKGVFSTKDAEEKEEDIRKARIVDYYLERDLISANIRDLILAIITWIASFAIYPIILLTLMSRAFELYLYLMVSPITLTMFFNRSTTQNGVNFLKNIFAFGLQTLVIIFVLYIYMKLLNSFTTELLTTKELISMKYISTKILLQTMFCIFGILGSKTLAQRALGA